MTFLIRFTSFPVIRKKKVDSWHRNVVMAEERKGSSFVVLSDFRINASRSAS
jgi:hypothetical protein